MSTTLEEVISPDRTVTVNGSTYQIREPDAFGWELVAKAEETQDTRLMCKVIARCLGLTVDDVYGTEEKVGFSTSDVAAALKKIVAVVKRVEASASPLSEPAGETQKA